MNKQMEMAQLLARFKLQAKRTLGESVDLERLTRDPAYARQRLNEIEDLADDEDLLIMVLRLRDYLLPVVPEQAANNPPISEVATSRQVGEMRNYLKGARSW
ncbi:hypothetical protein [Azonexus sp.]|uniref:hypothetical protein n=1 Tax=Azonexus sp. TaxID=1872668 RepID=UPI0027BA1E6D|nr:hypothetical protein [Azonexus sp.]